MWVYSACLLLFLTLSQSIKRIVDHRTVDLYAKFVEELNLVKKEFSQQSPILPRSQPNYAGMASWARLLKKRIDTPMKVNCKYFACTVQYMHYKYLHLHNYANTCTCEL